MKMSVVNMKWQDFPISLYATDFEICIAPVSLPVLSDWYPKRKAIIAFKNEALTKHEG